MVVAVAVPVELHWGLMEEVAAVRQQQGKRQRLREPAAKVIAGAQLFPLLMVLAVAVHPVLVLTVQRMARAVPLQRPVFPALLLPMRVAAVAAESGMNPLVAARLQVERPQVAAALVETETTILAMRVRQIAAAVAVARQAVASA